ncbi:hypothetical protein NRC85_004019 [Vibrio parahaemolyticus]|nr:hypothetical protein [Vibrio parahaemolyticus]
MSPDTIAYFYTDKCRANLKRAQVQATNVSSMMVVRPLNWGGSIDWTSIFLVFIDYDSEHHSGINKLLSRISTLDRPPIVIVDPTYKYDADELEKASELSYFHCIRKPINQADLRKLIIDAKKRYAQESCAKEKWPVVMQNKVLSTIKSELTTLNPGEINYVLNQLQEHNQLFTKFLLGMNRAHVDSKYLLVVAQAYKSNYGLVSKLLSELRKRGDYYITSRRIRAELIMSNSIELSTREHNKQLITVLQTGINEANFVRKVLSTKIRSGHASDLTIVLERLLETNASEPGDIIEKLSSISLMFFSFQNELKPSRLRSELHRFKKRLNRKLAFKIQTELVVLYHILLGIHYYMNKMLYAARIHAMRASLTFDRLSPGGQLKLLIPLLLLCVWLGDARRVSELIKLGETNGGRVRVSGVARENFDRYKQLQAMFKMVRGFQSNGHLFEEIIHSFPCSELVSLIRNRLDEEEKLSFEQNLPIKLARVEKRLQAQNPATHLGVMQVSLEEVYF